MTFRASRVKARISAIEVSDLTLPFVIRYKSHILATWKTKQDNSTNYVLTYKTIRRNDVPMPEKTKRIAYN